MDGWGLGGKKGKGEGEWEENGGMGEVYPEIQLWYK